MSLDGDGPWSPVDMIHSSNANSCRPEVFQCLKRCFPELELESDDIHVFHKTKDQRSGMDYLLKGIVTVDLKDRARLTKTGKGRKFTDSHWPHGDILIEEVSARRKGAKDTLGWIHYCSADWLVYPFLDGVVVAVPTIVAKSVYESVGHRYTQMAADNPGYKTISRIIPLHEFAPYYRLEYWK